MTRPASPAGHLRALNYAADLPDLLPLLRASFARDDEDPATEQTLRRLDWLILRVPRGTTTEAQVVSGRAPFFGWVWEHAGRAVGLVALVHAAGRPRRYLLTNIVVHPDYRGQGIGRALIRRALDYIQRRGAQAWLEVDAQNTRAQRLYEALGFVRVDQRVDWYYPLDVFQARAWRGAARARASHGRDAPAFAAWLEEAYPRAFQWRWPPQPLHRTMRPGWLGALARFWHAATDGRVWTVEEGGRPVAVWAWWPEPGPVQRTLYLAAAEDLSPDAVQAGLHALAQVLEPVAVYHFRSGRMLTEPYHLYLNLPLARHAETLPRAGWRQQRVVWWMRFAGG